MLTEKDKLNQRFNMDLIEVDEEIKNRKLAIDKYQEHIDKLSIDIVELEERRDLLQKCKAALND